MAGDLTELLTCWHKGDEGALERLVETVYPELRRIAAARLSRERSGTIIEASELVHEAFLRLAEMHHIDWKSRKQLYALATIIMRRILVERARARRGLKRGGGVRAVTLHSGDLVAAGPDLDLVSLDGALARLAELYPRKARIVELRAFGGMTMDEVAESLQASKSTVEREWRFACAWLRRELGSEGAPRD